MNPLPNTPETQVCKRGLVLLRNIRAYVYRRRPISPVDMSAELTTQTSGCACVKPMRAVNSA